MDNLKVFLNNFYSEYDIVENERGTFVSFHLCGELPLYFARNEDEKEDFIDEGLEYLGDYYDNEEGETLSVFVDEED